MNAWSWEAGNASGISGERRQARRHAEAALRSGDADRAELQMVVVATGLAVLDGHYVAVAGTKATGRRDGCGIVWSEAA